MSDLRNNETREIQRVFDDTRRPIAANTAARHAEKHSHNYVVQSTYAEANGITLNTGTSGDALADLQAPLDGNVYTILEVSGAPGIDIEVAFVDVEKISSIAVSAYYEGSVSHAIRIQLYNYTDTTWDTVHTIYHGLDYEQHFKTITDDTNYIYRGAAIVRLYHTESGTPSHDLHIDYVGLGTGFSIEEL